MCFALSEGHQYELTSNYYYAIVNSDFRKKNPKDILEVITWNCYTSVHTP